MAHIKKAQIVFTIFLAVQLIVNVADVSAKLGSKSARASYDYYDSIFDEVKIQVQNINATSNATNGNGLGDYKIEKETEVKVYCTNDKSGFGQGWDWLSNEAVLKANDTDRKKDDKGRKNKHRFLNKIRGSDKTARITGQWKYYKNGKLSFVVKKSDYASMLKSCKNIKGKNYTYAQPGSRLYWYRFELKEDGQRMPANSNYKR